MVEIEYAIDFIFCLEIIMNFFKKTFAFNDLKLIALNYIQTFFFFDVIASVSGLYSQQSIHFYWLKLFRIVHLPRLTEPLSLLMRFLLKNYSKKR